MSNYATLKSAIQQVIKTNGNNEITGALLQQSLLSMINSLGVGYQYMGVATPTTNPGTPDQNVFYIASTVGTYANFDGVVLTDGEIAILKYNGDWSKDSTGAASLETVKQLGQDVYAFSGSDKLFNIAGYIRRTDGAEIYAPDWVSTDFIPCEQGIKLYVVIPTNNKLVWRVAFYDANKNYISGNENNGNVTVPAGASYFRASGNTADKNAIFKILEYFEDYFEDVEKSFGAIKDKLLFYSSSFKDKLLFYSSSFNISNALDVVNVPITSPLFEEYKDGFYIKPTGALVQLSIFKVIRIPIDYDIRIINVKSIARLTYIGAIEYNDGVFENCGQNINELGDNNVFGVALLSRAKYLYINVKKTDPSVGAEYVQFVLSEPQKTFVDGTTLKAISVDSLIERDKYVNNNGQFINLPGCAIYKIVIDADNYNYKFVNAQSIIGAYFDGTGNVVGRIYANTASVQVPFGAKYALVNAQYNTTVFAFQKTIKNKNYCTVLGQKLDFTNKSIAFFGDSITAGVGASESSKRWVNIFSQKLIDHNGLLSFRNLGSSGATFVSGQAGRAQIEALIRAETISEEIIIIAAGTNDYGVNVPIGKSDDNVDTKFYGALNSLTNYLSQNYSNKTIIFVLPVGRFLTDVDNDMDAYRKIIFATAVKYGFGVIDGSEFGLPCNAEIMPDGLHPGDIGHLLYANRMYDFLGK